MDAATFHLLVDNFGAGNRHFEPFAPHRFDEDRELEFSTRSDLDGVAGSLFVDRDRDAGLLFLLKSLTDLVDREELAAILTCERRVVGVEIHAEGRWLDLDARQLFDRGC